MRKVRPVQRGGRVGEVRRAVPIGSEEWGRYFETTKEKIKYGEEVASLVRRFAPHLMSLSLIVQPSPVPCGDTRLLLNYKRS